MNPTFDAFLRSWPFEPWLLVCAPGAGGHLSCAAGSSASSGSGPLARAPACRFPGRLAALFLALASPIEPFTSLLLQVHMLQHLLLMMVAPPLLWLGAPAVPLAAGAAAADSHLLGRPAVSLALSCVASSRSSPTRCRPGCSSRRPPGSGTCRRSTSSPCASDGWHYLQHVCFLGTALLFWYPVIRPYPAGRAGRPGCWSLT